MIVTFKDGTTREMHVSNVAGYSAASITLGPKDCEWLTNAYLLGPEAFRSVFLQLMARTWRVEAVGTGSKLP